MSAVLTGREVAARITGTLSPRETEACLWVAEGKEDGAIGVLLGISPRTAKAHVSTAMLKVGVHNRAHLISRLYQLGVLTRAALLALAVLGATAHSTDPLRRPPARPAPSIVRTSRNQSPGGAA